MTKGERLTLGWIVVFIIALIVISGVFVLPSEAGVPTPTWSVYMQTAWADRTPSGDTTSPGTLPSPLPTDWQPPAPWGSETAFCAMLTRSATDYARQLWLPMIMRECA